MFLDTEPVTLPPASSIRSPATSRDMLGSVPVMTKVLPASGPSVPGRRPGLLELQAVLAQAGDQLAGAVLGQGLDDRLGQDRPDPGVSVTCSGVASSSASMVRKCAVSPRAFT